jgi:F0F1-type ATP synthase assembly protein I
MAKAAAGSAKSTKVTLTKDEKKTAKVARKAASKERRKQLWQAFQMQRKDDKKLVPLMLGALLLGLLVGLGVAWLFGSGVFGFIVGPILGLTLGGLGAMLIFARRVQANVYKQAEGNPGAAAWSLQNNLRGKWRISPAIVGTAQFDAVHRVIGRPGVVLIAEGVPQRVIPLLAQEKKRVARVVGDTVPIYDIVVGNEENQTPLKRLNATLTKLPRNISPAQVETLDTKLKALAGRTPQAGMPKGPMPGNVKARNIQRAARRR